MSNENVIYFELNNWFEGMDYPAAEPFISWMHDDLSICFLDESWVEKNNLCVVVTLVDMSYNFCITATKKWVDENCPSLLDEYNSFIRVPNEDGDVEGRFGCYFLEYSKENIGIDWHFDFDF